MQQFILLILFIILLSRCSLNSKKSKLADELEVKDTILYFSCGADTTFDFGYKYYSDVSIVQPRAICLNEHAVYMPDPLHHRINKINLINGKIFRSNSFDDSIREIRDIIYFQERILATTSNGYLIQLDENLKLISIERISEETGVFVKIEDNFFTLYYAADDFVSYDFNKNFKIVDTSFSRVDFRNRNRSRKFLVENNGNKINTNYGRIKPLRPYRRLEAGGINVYYSKDYFCFYIIEKNQIQLIVQKAKWH